MKKNFKIIRILIFVFSIFCFLIFLLSGIFLLVSSNPNTWVLSVSISLINFLLSSVLSFINLIVVPKKFKGIAPTEKFSDRKEIIQKILKEINNETKTIKITGYPFSGKSELLRYVYKLITEKKYLLQCGIDKSLAKKLHRKIGCVHYIDGDQFIGEFQKLLKDIENLSYSKHKSTIILLDNIYKINNPYNVLEILAAKKRRKVHIIYTLNHDAFNSFELTDFTKKDIYELASKYELKLSHDEINNIYLSTQGNIGLLNIILNNYNSQNYISLLNSIDNNEVSLKSQYLIEDILKDNEVKQLALLCATLNYCENSFNQSKLSNIVGYNITSLDLSKLVATGLFSYKTDTYYSSDYISQLIRSIDYKVVSKIIPRLIKYYSNKQNNKAVSILLLCKGKLTQSEAEQVKAIIISNSLKQSINNLEYVMKIGQAYKEISTLDFSSSNKHNDLKDEIIYQYANALIYIGDYKSANKIIDDNSSSKLLYTKADLFHLQNDYNTAIGLFTVIINNNLPNAQMAKIKLAHCYKHMGYFIESLKMLEAIENDESSSEYIRLRAKTDSLSLYILLNDFSGLANKIHDISSCAIQLKEYQIATLKRYNAILLAYKNKYNKALKEINEAIKICNKTDSRLRYNCYYIRGEINRHFNNYKFAFNDFLQCYRVTLWNDDYNLRSMSILSLYFIKNKINIDLPNCNLPELLDICIQNNMPYNVKILKVLLQSITMNKLFHKSFENKYFIVP